MISIEAPYPDIASILVLPEPELGNAMATTSGVQVKRMMDGTLETYINKREQKSYRFTVVIPKVKAIQVLDFFSLYLGSKIRYKDVTRTVIGYITKNPLELDMQRRAVSQNSQEDVDLELTLEATE